MKKVLLFADIGGHEYEKYYHAGDEAMLYETSRWYKKNHPNWELTLLSWFPIHSKLAIPEKPHLHWSKKRSYLYFPLLCAKLFCWKIAKISFFSSSESSLIETLQHHDRIHFTGGGNLSTQFRQWMYYSFFVILTAKLLKKEILLTSQTLGPITGIDKIFAFFILNLPNLVAIRESTNRIKEFLKNGIFLPKVEGMLDAAYTLPISKSQLSILRKKNLTIGLSLHAWEGWEKAVTLLVQKLLSSLSKKYSLTVVLIPHHLVFKSAGTDLEYMRKIAASLPKKVTVVTPSLQTILKRETLPATYIKKLTSKVDFLLSTRYHGLIFALSENIPTIALQLDGYYQMKNKGALKMFYKGNASRYQVTIQDTKAFDQLLQKTTHIIENLREEKSLLQKINDKIATQEKTLNSVMIDFENL